jgi:two-component system, NtrC family, nitrogen regulation response regulator GlnG
MPFDLQTRLLRVLSDGHFYRVGGHTAIKTQVRVVAATHQDLELRVAAGGFREDLFHRLNVIRLRLPALRERLDDIPVLVHHFMLASAKQLGVEAKRVSPQAMAVLSTFSFPGNVRQLENLCHWLTVMAPAQVVDVKDLPPEVLTAHAAAPRTAPAMPAVPNTASAAHASELSAAHTGLQHGASSQAVSTPGVSGVSGVQGLTGSTALTGLDWPDQVRQEALALLADGHQTVWDELTRKLERALIDAALMHTGGKRVEAANRLGIGRNTITRKIQELGLDEG